MGFQATAAAQGQVHPKQILPRLEALPTARLQNASAKELAQSRAVKANSTATEWANNPEIKAEAKKGQQKNSSKAQSHNIAYHAERACPALCPRRGECTCLHNRYSRST